MTFVSRKISQLRYKMEEPIPRGRALMIANLLWMAIALGLLFGLTVSIQSRCYPNKDQTKPTYIYVDNLSEMALFALIIDGVAFGLSCIATIKAIIDDEVFELTKARLITKAFSALVGEMVALIFECMYMAQLGWPDIYVCLCVFFTLTSLVYQLWGVIRTVLDMKDISTGAFLEHPRRATAIVVLVLAVIPSILVFVVGIALGGAPIGVRITALSATTRRVPEGCSGATIAAVSTKIFNTTDGFVLGNTRWADVAVGDDPLPDVTDRERESFFYELRSLPQAVPG